MGVQHAILQPRPLDQKAIEFSLSPRVFELLVPCRLKFWIPHRLEFHQGVLDFFESATGPFGSAHPAFPPKIDWQWKPVEKV